MSIFYYEYECPECGITIDELAEGVSPFQDANYISLQCPACKKVESINVPHEKERTRDFPLSECCHVTMRKWDESCPLCGKKMIQTFLWDDF